MTNTEKRMLARQVEDFLAQILVPMEDKEVEEAAKVIRTTVEDFLDSEVAERTM